MDIREIQRAFNNCEYFSHIVVPRKYDDGYVFNENLSVKENRLLVEEHNKKVDELRKQFRDENRALEDKLRQDVVNYIVREYDLSEARAKLVEDYAYTEYHAAMCDYFDNIDDLALLVEMVVGLE